ncbi:TIGR02302 family protein [Geminicoccaceae bacterium 1502E]|nr:TIGR02302 family protein [Geminicoccaceae bacterium 1502E]
MKAADPRTTRSFRARLAAARAAVTFERAWPALAPAAAVALLFVTLALFGLWQKLPFWAHLAGLVLFAVAFGRALWAARAALAPAGTEAGLQRLEADSGIRHQALRALGDRLPDGLDDPTTRTLWERHRQQLRGTLSRLRLAPPRSDLPRRDPWALRALLLLVMVVALVDARGQVGERLATAFVPRPAPAVAAPAAEASLWITPPAYTRRPPLGLEQTAAAAAVSVPAGSEALVQVHHLPPGAAGEVRVVLDEESEPTKELAGGSLEARFAVDRSGSLRVLAAADNELAAWQLELLADEPPTARLPEQPGVTHRSSLRLAFEASDDYGVAEVALLLAPPDRLDEAERLSLTRPASQPAAISSHAYSDLTAHPLAGLPVRLWIEAVDGAGQTGTSEALEVVLPARTFRHPLARAVIEQRRRLVAAPEQRRDVAGAIEGLARSRIAGELPAVVPLSLHIAALRTLDAAEPARRRAVVDLLWELALFIEEGQLATAENELRALQDQLQQALERNAEDAEIDRLMAELQQAIDRYLEEMARQAMQMPPQDQGPRQPIDPSQLVAREDLQRMLERARELMRNGSREAAREMLAQLREMLENLQMAQGQMQPSPEEQALGDLQRMIELQQNLLDRSFEMQRQGEMGQSPQQAMPGEGEGQAEQGRPGDSPGRAAMEQEGLRRALGELMRRMGEQGMAIPRALGQAEMEMRAAREALGEEAPARAVPPQGEAVDHLQQGGQAMLEQMRQQLGQGPGPGGEPLRQGRRGRDPLGRAQFNDGGWDPSGTALPEDADLGRARGVLEELYRRSGERHRPPVELDYYKRLLDRF